MRSMGCFRQSCLQRSNHPVCKAAVLLAASIPNSPSAQCGEATSPCGFMQASSNTSASQDACRRSNVTLTPCAPVAAQLFPLLALCHGTAPVEVLPKCWGTPQVPSCTRGNTKLQLKRPF